MSCMHRGSISWPVILFIPRTPSTLSPHTPRWVLGRTKTSPPYVSFTTLPSHLTLRSNQDSWGVENTWTMALSHCSSGSLVEGYRYCMGWQFMCFSHFQVKRCDGGGYIDVPYIADAILVNLGALMQQWTSDIYLATVRQNIQHLWKSIPFGWTVEIACQSPTWLEKTSVILASRLLLYVVCHWYVTSLVPRPLGLVWG